MKRITLFVFLLVALAGVARSSTSLNNMDPTTLLYSAAECDAAFQPKDADLTALAGLTSAVDKLPYFTGVGTASTTDFTTAARALLDDAAPANMRTTLGLGSLATASSVSTGSVDFAATQRVLGRNTAGAGVGEEVTASTVLDWIGSTRGQVLYRGSGGWSALSPGTSGYVLTSNGAGADPTYQTVGAAALDINGLTAETDPASADTVPMYDASAAANRKVRLDEMRAYMQAGHCGMRLAYSSATSLALLPRTSLLIEVNGEVLDGTAYAVATTDNLITSAGADSGAAMSTSTVYYIYVSNSLASTWPNDLRASTTTPVSNYGGGVGPSSLNTAYPDLYLNTTGNGLNWRFVGMARTNGSTQFTDSTTSRLVLSYYNRVDANLVSCPAYSNGNTATSWTTTSTSWVQANAGTGSRVEWLSFGDESVDITAYAMATNSGANSDYVGIGLDSTTDCLAMGQSYPNNTAYTTMTARWTAIPTFGYHYAEMMVRVSAGTGTYYADNTRNGAVADPYMTYITAVVSR